MPAFRPQVSHSPAISTLAFGASSGPLARARTIFAENII